MTHNIQKSFFTSGRIENRRYYPGLFFDVVVNTEDESFEYEVEADTFADACAQAEELANSLMCDITYIEIYSQAMY